MAKCNIISSPFYPLFKRTHISIREIYIFCHHKVALFRTMTGCLIQTGELVCSNMTSTVSKLQVDIGHWKVMPLLE